MDSYEFQNYELIACNQLLCTLHKYSRTPQLKHNLTSHQIVSLLRDHRQLLQLLLGHLANLGSLQQDFAGLVDVVCLVVQVQSLHLI